MPTVDNVKLTLKKEAFKPTVEFKGGSKWAGDKGGNWKATVTCDIKMEKSEPMIPYQVIITLYGKAVGDPLGSWVCVHRFYWTTEYKKTGIADFETVWKSTKKFSQHNYIAGKKLNVNKAVKVSTSLGPGLKKTTVFLARPEKIRAHVLVQKKGQGADSNEVKIKI